MTVSVWGQSALADEVIHELEEQALVEMLEILVFDHENGLLPPQLLEQIGMKRKEVKKLLHETFINPISIEEIVEYAQEEEMEEVFYQQACWAISSDEKIEDNEKRFLNNFAKELGISKLDKNRIEREILGQTIF